MPNTLIGKGLIKDLKRAEESAMPDISVIERTGETDIPVRVSDASSRSVHVEGTPSYMKLKEWQLTFKETTDVKQGDTVVVRNNGTYLVTEISFTASFHVARVVFAVKLYDEHGAIGFMTNYTVTFRSHDTNETLTTDVFIWDTSMTLMVMGAQQGVPVYQWNVLFDNRAHYMSRTPPSNTPIGPQDQILWGYLGIASDGTVKSAPITKPRPDSLIPQLSVAHFNEKP